MSYKFILYIIYLFITLPTIIFGTGLGNSTNKTGGFDDRINLHFGYGHADAQNPDGSYSASDASSYGYQAGILYPAGSYKPLASQSGADAKTYSEGGNAPSTFANAENHVGPEGGGGNVTSGFAGGKGNAWADSHSEQIAIPLGDEFGGVLLTNLRPLNHTSKKVEAEKPAQSSKRPSYALVFH